MIQLIKPVQAVIYNPAVTNGLEASMSPDAYVNKVIQTIFHIFFIVGVLYFIWHFVMAGYHYIASEGDPKNIEKSKNELTYSILGLGVVFIVFAVLKLVGKVTGIQGLETLTLPFPHLLSSGAWSPIVAPPAP